MNQIPTNNETTMHVIKFYIYGLNLPQIIHWLPFNH